MSQSSSVSGFPYYVHHLSDLSSGIIQAMEKLQKKCIIKFTETDMHVICNDEANEGGIQVWS